jgi:tRNA (cytidine32/uridine32-2'-O)-methyltransferase
MAVQTLCYEVRMAFLAEQERSDEASESSSEDESIYPSSKQMELFYDHLEDTLNETGFIVKQHPGIVMTKLRRLFNRARPEEVELNILRGILSSIGKTIKNTKD